MSEWEPTIVAFLCNWCSYGAADLAGVGRMEYPSNIRVVRIPCTGRMDPTFFLAALREGAEIKSIYKKSSAYFASLR